MRFFPNAVGSLPTVQGTPPAGAPLLGGLAFNALNEVYVTTTLGANDTFINGFRVSALGHLVVGDGIAASRPYVFNGGFPFDKRNGALIRQLGQTAAATDPFVQGVRVGELGGVYAIGGPANLTLPVVTGTPTVGQVLTCTAGTWQGTPAITYLWFVDGVATGTTTNTYTVTAGNVTLGSFIYCQVTATDVTGVTSVNSNVLTTAILPVNTVAPVISGSTVPGSTLTSTTGSWTGSPTPVYTYQWNASGVAIPGATANTYVIAAQGTSYTCTVTGTNNAGAVSATSNAIVSQTAPANTTAPTVTGDATVGNVLTCSQGTWTGSPTIIYGYQWLKNGSEISGEVSTTYTSVTGDIGATIACRVTGTNITGASSATSNGLVITAAVIAPPANTVLPAVTGNAVVGSLLSCTSGTWTGQAPITYVYQWKADTVNIAGATNATYTTLIGDVGKTITCRVTATNVGGATIATSNGIVVTNVPAFTPASLFASGEEGAWYDPSDFSTMFQDSAGTTPVTAVGQSVGKINDKSGRGNNATQATAASRPVLRQDANSKYYLEFDGVDDSLTTAAINFTATDKMSVFSGVHKATAASWQQLIELSANSDNNDGSFGINAPAGDATSYAVYLNGLTGIPDRVVTGYSAPITNVLAFSLDLSAASASAATAIKVNAVSVTGTVNGVAPGGANFGTYPIYIGARAGVSTRFSGRIYSLIVRGAQSTTQEITDTETWVNGKTGAY